MRVKSLQLRVAASDVLHLHPLSVHREEGVYLVGARAASGYVSTSESGAMAVRLLSEGLAVGAVHKRMEEVLGTSNFTLVPLLEKLLASGLVRAVGEQELKQGNRRQAGIPFQLHERYVSGLFSSPAIAGYILAVSAAVGLLLLQNGYLLRPSEIFANTKYSVLGALVFVIGIVNGAKHELAHAVAAAYLGVTARFSIGHRFLFPVLQTDLTDLWTVSRNKRFIAYAAGMISDLLTMAAIIIVSPLASWLARMSHLAVIEKAVPLVLTLTFLLAASQILWQFNIFVRTDVYYILANALNCRNLHGDAKAYLRGLAAGIARALGLPGGDAMRHRPALRIRMYAIVVAIGYALSAVYFASYLAGTFYVLSAGAMASTRALRLDGADKIAIALPLLIAIAVVAYSKYREMRSDRTVYHIRSLGTL